MNNRERGGWDPMVTVSLIAGIGFTASAEYQLARTIGAAVPVAILLPLALDVYVVAAIRRSRGADIALSLFLMAVAQVSAHLLSAHVVGVSVPLVVAVSLPVPLVIWRVHALANGAPVPGGQAVPVPVVEAVLERESGEPVPVSVPAAEAVLDAVPVPAIEAVPETAAVSVPVPVPAEEAVPEAVLTELVPAADQASEAVPVPVVEAVLEAPVKRPELQAVPGPAPARVPVRRSRRMTPSTGRRSKAGTARPKTPNASFDEHVSTAREWLADEPELSGTAIGKRLGTGDSYGRRVRRAALDEQAAPGREHPTHTRTEEEASA